mmetsp:Transcript_4173/g.7973  ORF Transcript_4173/g.7973 Transcript_4173/m.7973 type:complete len:121 (+) Transcript_4173:398-760(+)
MNRLEYLIGLIATFDYQCCFISGIINVCEIAYSAVEFLSTGLNLLQNILTQGALDMQTKCLWKFRDWCDTWLIVPKSNMGLNIYAKSHNNYSAGFVGVIGKTVTAPQNGLIPGKAKKVSH